MTQLVDHSIPTTPKTLLALVSKRLVGLTARRTGFCVGLSGAAGIGKTHTALELLQASPCRFKVTQATVGIQALTNLLRGSKKLPSVIERNLQRIQNGERLELQTLIDVYAAMLSSQAPFVLLIEDMHEASTEQMEFWNALCKLVTRLSGVAIIQTSRARFTDPVENIALESLSPAQSKSLLEEHLNAKLPVAALDWIDSRCAGNPLFTLEFADFLTRHDALWNDGKTWKWREPAGSSIPNTVEAIVGQWLTDLALTPAARAALETKAYFETRAPGQVFDDSLWATLSGLPSEQISEAKAQLEVVGVLKQHTFAHPLYREVTAQHVNRQQLERLALRAVKHFELHNQVLILPFLDEAKMDRNLTLELLEGAANQARASGDTAGAGRLLARATAFAEGERKGAMAFEGATLLKNIDLQQALELAELASQNLIENIDSLLLMANLRFFLNQESDFDDILGRVPESEKQGIAWLERLIVLYNRFDLDKVFQILKNNPEVELTNNLTILNMLIKTLHSQKEYAWAIRLAQNIQIFDYSNLSQVDRIIFIEIKGRIYSIENNQLERELFYTKMINTTETLEKFSGTIDLFYRRGDARLALEKYSEALEDFQNAFIIAEKIGHTFAYASCQLAIGEIQILTADFEKAENNLIEALKYFEKLKFSEILSVYEAVIQLYSLWNNKNAKNLVSHYMRNAIQSSSPPLPLFEGMFLWIQSNLELSLGNVEQSLKIAEELLQKSFFVEGYMAQAQALKAMSRFVPAEEAYIKAMTAARADSQLRKEQVIGLELDNLTRDSSSARERLEWFKSRGLNAYVQLAERYFPELLETPQAPSSLTLENAPVLEVLGQMRINQHGKTAVVRGQKRQELLALLLHARMEGQSEIQMDDLREALYTEQNLKDGSSALRQTIYKTRIQYGQNVIVTTNNGYALGNLSSDAETFLNDGNTRLWRDAYLSGIQLDNSDSIQENLNSKLFAQANDLLETDPKESARAVSILLQSNPYNLEALQVLCRALRVSGQHGALKRSYQRAREAFVEIGERLPETWAAFLEG